ncbi:MAG: transketolase [Fretibacterium sp.]|nr:transketolase [Fretibacterium sp.]
MMLKDAAEIRELAKRIRTDILEMTYGAGANGGHLGGGLSCADILALLYGKVLNVSPESPLMPSRDRFLLSKGHVALAHYAALAEVGFITRDEMMSFETSGGQFPTHEVMNPSKGIETSSGSLGYGLSIGVGIALNAKRKGEQYRTYVLLGDGECNEGTVWEAAMSASRFHLDNLTAIVDVNEQSLDGYTKDIMPVHDIGRVFGGLGFQVRDSDGHDVEQLYKALSSLSGDSPTAVIAHTRKGKGIRSIEGRTGWHHARLTQEQYEAFRAELEENS